MKDSYKKDRTIVNTRFTSFLDLEVYIIIKSDSGDKEYPEGTCKKNTADKDAVTHKCIKITNWYISEHLKEYLIEELNNGKSDLTLPFNRLPITYKILKAIELPIIKEISTSDNTKTWLDILKTILDYKKKKYDFSDDLFNDFLQRIYEIEKLDGLKKFKFEGQNIIFIICKFNFYKSVNFLKNIGFNFNDNLKYEETKENKIHIIGAAHIAAKHYNLGALRALSETSFNLSENIYFQVFDENRNLLNQDSALYQATYNNDYEMLNFLINSTGNKELYHAIDNNEEKSKKTTSLLYLAAYLGRYEIIKKLLEHYDPNIGTSTKSEEELIERSPLAAAINRDRYNITSLLIPKCNIESVITKKKQSQTETYSALYLAIKNNNIALAKLLLSHSSNQAEVMTIKYSDGHKKSTSALEFAKTKDKNKEIIELLKRKLKKNSSICQIM